MKSRITVIMVSLFAMALVGTVGCNKLKADLEKEIEAVEESKKAVKSSGKMNDEMYVEITAQIRYLITMSGILEKGGFVKLLKVSHQLDKKKRNVCNKFGVTADEYAAYDEKVKEDPTHKKLLMERALKRMEELQKLEE